MDNSQSRLTVQQFNPFKVGRKEIQNGFITN
jgi:hypothetical protein